MVDYVFFRFAKPSEMSVEQAKYFRGRAWKYVFKRNNRPDHTPETVERYLMKRIQNGKNKTGLWRVQKIHPRFQGGKEFRENYYYDLRGVW